MNLKFSYKAVVTTINWLRVPNVPEIEVGAISVIKSGETEEKAPADTPIMNLPIARE